MAEISELKHQLADLYTSVLTEMVEPRVGAVLAQITNARIRLTEVELRVREHLEIESRLEELERAQSTQEKVGRHWGV